MRCRLLYFIGELHTGGSERQLWYLLRSMDRERYKPAVAVWNYSERDIHVPLIRELNVPLYFFPKNCSRVAKLRACRALINKLQPEVIHSWSFYTNFVAYWAARRTRAVSLGSVRSDFYWAVKESGYVVGHLSARWPRWQICNSGAAADSIRRANGYFLPSEVYVVRNGVDLKQFAPSPMVAKEPVRILGVGYLVPVKRWNLLLDALAQLKQKGITYIAQIAGDGPLRPHLERLAGTLGISDRVHFLGHVHDIPQLVSDATVLVHTGDAEGCPNAVMEAMASGRAVVAMNAGDIPALIEHGTTGFVVSRGDTAALVEHLEKLISDFNLCRRMGEAARKNAQNAFGLDRLVEETFNVYCALGWRESQTGVNTELAIASRRKRDLNMDSST
jgi:glycosyltransferase involved in cell wall biosynthesis